MLTLPPGPGEAPDPSERTCLTAAAFFKALGHPLRVKIVCGLLSGPSTQSRIMTSLHAPQSSIAQHVAVLRRAGIVTGRRSGSEVLLSVADARTAIVLHSLCAGIPPCFDFTMSKSSPSA